MLADHSKKEGIRKLGMLSTMQIKSILWNGEMTYVTTLVEINPDVKVEISNDVVEIMGQFGAIC